jgi:hypothetical protein
MSTRSRSAPQRALAIAVALAVALGAATGAEAGLVSFREGQLSIYVRDLAPLSIPPAPPLESGFVNATRVGDTLVSLNVPPGLFQAQGLTAVFDEPIGLVTGVALTAANGQGSFSASGGGAFGGPMPIDGTLTICGLGSCPSPFSFEVPLDVVGVGGVYSNDFGFFALTMEGAPWSLGPVSIPTDAQGGSIQVSGSITLVAGPGSDLEVELVTPIFIETTDIPGFEVVPAWASLHLVVPEPGSATLGLAAIGSLLLVGRIRRRS